MDLLSLLTAAVALMGAEVARKSGGVIVDQTFKAIQALFKQMLDREPQPEDINPETVRKFGLAASPAFVERTQPLITQSSALRRAQLVQRVLQGARILWVDDHPNNNGYERRMLLALGISVDLATSTGEALEKVGHTSYDVILSDMARDRPDAGLVLLRRLRKAGSRIEVVFYVGELDADLGVPAGAFGITNYPEPLLHYVFDVLERSRV
jgi:CheY-like chemotaxis protein